jgi:hypothetical protein
MARSRSLRGDGGLPRTWVLVALLLAPAQAVAQEGAMTPEAASAALSQLGSIFLANNTGFGRTGAFNTKDGQWVQHPERGLTYVCNVEAAVIPTTPGAQNGVSYGTQVQVFVDPDTGRVRIEGGDSNGWNRTETSVDDLRARFPSEPPPEPQAPERQGVDAPGNEPSDTSAIDAAGGVVGILAGELGRIAGEMVAVAEIPPQVPDALGGPPSPPTTPPAPPTTGGPRPTVPPSSPPDDSPGPPVTTPPPDDSPPPPGTGPTPPPPPEPDRTPPEPPTPGGLQDTLDGHNPGRPDDEQAPPCHVREPSEPLGFDDCTDGAVIGGDPNQIPEDTRTPEERDEEARRQYEAMVQVMQQLEQQGGSAP